MAEETRPGTEDDAYRLPPTWGMVRFWCGVFMFTFSRRTVIGWENWAKTEPPYLFCINHLATLDSPLFFSMFPHRITGLAAYKYKRHPLFGPIIRSSGAIYVKRGAADRRALRQAMAALAGGVSVALAPEGTRSASHQLIQAKTGAAYLATRANVPIIPAAHWGTEQVLQGGVRGWLRPHITVRLGRPFRLPPGRARGRQLQEYTEQIMCRLAAMLPPAYRGYYADHPLTAQFEAQMAAEPPPTVRRWPGIAALSEKL